MSIKENRQARIIELVKNNAIDTQEELKRLLTEQGFSATQATISRDIRELRLVKSGFRAGVGYCYALPDAADRSPVSKNMLFGTVTSLDYALNTVVIKCHNGTANAACVVLENQSYPDVVGTIAGDDTIFVLMRSEKAARSFCAMLSKEIRLISE